MTGERDLCGEHLSNILLPKISLRCLSNEEKVPKRVFKKEILSVPNTHLSKMRHYAARTRKKSINVTDAICRFPSPQLEGLERLNGLIERRYAFLLLKDEVARRENKDIFIQEEEKSLFIRFRRFIPRTKPATEEKTMDISVKLTPFDY